MKLVHKAVVPPYPTVFSQDERIESVSSFRYLGVEICTKKLFCAFALPHFFWLFSTWFFYTENQTRKIEHMYCAGIRLINNLWGLNDHMTLVISQEKYLLDHVYVYWQKFTRHLIESSEGNEYRETWEAYLISKAPDEKFYKSVGVRKNNFFMNRYRERAHDTNTDIFTFFCVQEKQEFFQNNKFRN